MIDPKSVYCSNMRLIVLLVGDLDDFEWPNSRLENLKIIPQAAIEEI